MSKHQVPKGFNSIRNLISSDQWSTPIPSKQ